MCGLEADSLWPAMGCALETNAPQNPVGGLTDLSQIEITGQAQVGCVVATIFGVP